MKKIDLAAFPTPYFVVDEARLRHNLAILKGVCDRTGCKILLAQKAFSMFAAYPIIREYLAGTTASRLFPCLPRGGICAAIAVRRRLCL